VRRRPASEPARSRHGRGPAGDAASGRRVGAALLAALLWAVSAGLAAGEDDRPRVAATIFPLFDIARQVAGPAANVALMLPPGASPHTFEPTPSQVRALAGARMVVVIGHGLDDWAARLGRSAGVSRVVVVDRGVALRREAGGTVDPHYWLAPANARAIARTVAGELEGLAPARRSEIHSALARYLGQLGAVEAEIRRILADLPTRRIATFHDAFGYFAEAFGLEVAAVFEPYPGREPSPRFVAEFQRRVRASGVRTLFAEPQLSLEPLRPVARDLGVTLSVLDPLGGVAGRDTYLELLRFNARQVAAAVRGRTP
jgi:ABC-type Zn uptake system ZnuABC Zn-binding protein ZnuA